MELNNGQASANRSRRQPEKISQLLGYDITKSGKKDSARKKNLPQRLTLCNSEKKSCQSSSKKNKFLRSAISEKKVKRKLYDTNDNLSTSRCILKFNDKSSDIEVANSKTSHVMQKVLQYADKNSLGEIKKVNKSDRKSCLIPPNTIRQNHLRTKLIEPQNVSSTQINKIGENLKTVKTNIRKSCSIVNSKSSNSNQSNLKSKKSINTKHIPEIQVSNVTIHQEVLQNHNSEKHQILERPTVIINSSNLLPKINKHEVLENSHTKNLKITISLQNLIHIENNIKSQVHQLETQLFELRNILVDIDKLKTNVDSNNAVSVLDNAETKTEQITTALNGLNLEVTENVTNEVTSKLCSINGNSENSNEYVPLVKSLSEEKENHEIMNDSYTLESKENYEMINESYTLKNEESYEMLNLEDDVFQKSYDYSPNSNYEKQESSNSLKNNLEQDLPQSEMLQLNNKGQESYLQRCPLKDYMALKSNISFLKTPISNRAVSHIKNSAMNSATKISLSNTVLTELYELCTE